VITIIAVLLSAIACGATFLFALYRQFALVEAAASMAIGVELYFLSSSIGDAPEDKGRAWQRQAAAAPVSAVGVVVAYFLVSRYLRG